MAEIVLYFSRAGENYVSGALKYLETGNTKIAAEIIGEMTGAGLFEIRPARPYAEDYNSCIEEARQEQKRDARPELACYPENLDGVDVIYLGYPTYWGTMPMPVFTLLEKYECAGKIIYPFCTHEGSGMGHSEMDIRRICPGAEVKKGLAIHGTKVREAERDIRKWLGR